MICPKCHGNTAKKKNAHCRTCSGGGTIGYGHGSVDIALTTKSQRKKKAVIS